MEVRDVMTRGVECTRPQSLIQEAAVRMRELNIGTLPVCGDETEKLVGMLTDRDIVVRAVADGKTPSATHVSEVMTPEILYCFDDMDIKEAAQIMKENQVRRLVVLNRDKRLVGIVSLGDLAVETRGGVLAGETLERISEPVHQTSS